MSQIWLFWFRQKGLFFLASVYRAMYVQLLSKVFMTKDPHCRLFSGKSAQFWAPRAFNENVPICSIITWQTLFQVLRREKIGTYYVATNGPTGNKKKFLLYFMYKPQRAKIRENFVSTSFLWRCADASRLCISVGVHRYWPRFSVRQQYAF